ncbi:DUF72 domain-containing protein [Deminuibacter soli]|uniref:DUF72 domain-containing protein n=1 Tax=Deminuibacter soli TaxID=2291815 RepID=A0A3E1NRW2_9BACT|nr:DUF72 domain-containing protein [Deminuibacter soli]RFM30650.1 DUF72 domain-containing protein [Deminuibacter soli]
MRKGNLHIGTSGWSYKHWKGLFYPDKMKPTDWLLFYAQTFGVTEINTSFYSLPKPAAVDGWLNKTPAHFLFCPKMSRYLTHMKHLHDPEVPLQRFFDVFDRMQSKMGPVLLQLPPSLRFNPAICENLFSLLKKQYHQYDFALEVRHESWLQQESISLMKHYHIAFVVAQSGKGFPYAEYSTAKHMYIRFHGPEGLYNSAYTGKQLQYFAAHIKEWRNSGHNVWAFFNNDISGYAIENARQLLTLLQ